ncbi:hypothetical protein SAMN04488696_0463 [Methanolobus profundi]|uniref:Uncharacterized protein n=2 Tax=Methanolobus profundi TaxID=487685 RepID=A0A1I4P5Y1_9EURY|nr:hypothetical protein SAMN04488696_0463 [Methanolobus profundi]
MPVSEFSHLIEMYFEDDNYIIVSESVVYSTGSVNDSDDLVLWIPENAEIMQFLVTDMTGSASETSVNYSREGNFIYFSADESSTSNVMPLLYGIRYVVHSHEDVATFNKVIRSEGILDYPISRLIIVVNHENSEIPSITSANGIQLVADQASNDDGKTSYIWSSPAFDEFSVTLQSPNSYTNTGTGYNYSLIIGIVLLIVVIGAVLYYKKDSSGKLGELEELYEAELAVIAQIESDRKKKKLSKDDFERIHKKHSDSAAKIKEKMEKLKKT